MVTSVWTFNLGFAGKAESTLLVHAARRSDQALDIDLTATDGDEAWRFKLRERKIDRIREKTYNGSEEEWLSILSYVFTSGSHVDLPQTVKDSIHPVCEKVDSSLKIVIRTKVDDIVHRLGTIELAQSRNNDDVNIFDWALAAVESRNAVSAEAYHLRSEILSKDQQVEELSAQLKELIVAKQEQEKQMLAKFTILLNEKKARIRALQRQMVEEIRAAPSSMPKEPANTKSQNRAGKRPADKDESDDESDAFDSIPSRPGRSKIDGASNNQSEQNTTASEDTLDSSSSDTSEVNETRPARTRLSEDDLPPPPRHLPFGKPAATVASVSQQNPDTTMKDADMDHHNDDDDDDETASGEDEL